MDKKRIWLSFIVSVHKSEKKIDYIQLKMDSYFTIFRGNKMQF